MDAVDGRRGRGGAGGVGNGSGTAAGAGGKGRGAARARPRRLQWCTRHCILGSRARAGLAPFLSAVVALAAARADDDANGEAGGRKLPAALRRVLSEHLLSADQRVRRDPAAGERRAFAEDDALSAVLRRYDGELRSLFAKAVDGALEKKKSTDHAAFDGNVAEPKKASPPPAIPSSRSTGARASGSKAPGSARSVASRASPSARSVRSAASS